MTIRDKTGIAQIIFSKKETEKDIFDLARNVSRQSAVSIKGMLKEGKGKDVPIEIKALDIKILSEASQQLPFDPTGRVEASIDLRLDSRALDLRNPKIMSIFRIRHFALQSIRKTLIQEGFLEVTTSKIIGQAAEGGANLFPFEYFDKEAYLAQSPQLYKEQLTLSLDRVFEIANFYRAEKSHTTRHLNEFTSVDIEAAFSEKEHVMDIAEKMVVNVLEDVSDKCEEDLKNLNQSLEQVKRPFQKISYNQAIEELSKKGLEISEGEDLKDHDLRTLGELHQGYYWIVDWPAKLKPFYIARTPDKKTALSFDLQYGFIELASGGKRVSDNNELIQRLQESGLSPKSFDTHHKTFTWGMPPHSGWGFGFDRFMMVLTGMKNIREVVLYPRDQFRLKP